MLLHRDADAPVDDLSAIRRERVACGYGIETSNRPSAADAAVWKRLMKGRMKPSTGRCPMSKKVPSVKVSCCGSRSLQGSTHSSGADHVPASTWKPTTRVVMPPGRSMVHDHDHLPG